MLERLELHRVPLSSEHRVKGGIPWPQVYGVYLEQCQAVHDTLQPLVRIMSAEIAVAGVKIDADGGAADQRMNAVQAVRMPAVLLVRFEPD